MKSKIILSILCLLTSMCASAVEWEKILSDNKEVTYVDTDSFMQNNNMPSLIVKTLRADNPKQQKEFARYEFICAKHLYRVIDAKDKRLQLSNQAFYAVPSNSKVAQIESLSCQIHRMVGGS